MDQVVCELRHAPSASLVRGVPVQLSAVARPATVLAHRVRPAQISRLCLTRVLRDAHLASGREMAAG
jgi:hypothetical protein